MPVGTFLEAFPVQIFIAAHIALVGLGLWAIQRTKSSAPWVTGPLWLYVVSQPVFLLFFAGWITRPMAVFTEQMLMMVMVIWIALNATKGGARTS